MRPAVIGNDFVESLRDRIGLRSIRRESLWRPGLLHADRRIGQRQRFTQHLLPNRLLRVAEVPGTASDHNDDERGYAVTKCLPPVSRKVVDSMFDLNGELILF